jgi:hypothetical protein
MSTFGSKESWMEPMNQFLNSHRQEFKTFIDTICDVSPEDRSLSSLPPSYSTPLAILQRLPPTSREGFPSLPYLIDHAKNFADLVNLWLDNLNPDTTELVEDPDCPEGQGDIAKFHALCQGLRNRTRECLERAERAERPDSSLSMKFEELVEQLEQTALIDPVSTVPSSHPPPPPAPPSNFPRHRQTGTTSSSASTAGPYSPSSDIAPDETPPGSASGQAIGFGSSISSAPLVSAETRSIDGSSNFGHVGSNVSSDAEYTTALPRLERSEKEKDKEKKKLGFVGGFKKRREKMIEREREREKEMFRGPQSKRDPSGEGGNKVTANQGWLNANGGVF